MMAVENNAICSQFNDDNNYNGGSQSNPWTMIIQTIIVISSEFKNGTMSRISIATIFYSCQIIKHHDK